MAIREEFENFRWFLDFIYTDIASLSDQKKKLLLFNLLDRAYVTPLNSFAATLASSSLIREIFEIQAKLKDCFSAIIKEADGKTQNSGYDLVKTVISKGFTTKVSVILAGSNKEGLKLSCETRTDPDEDKPLLDFLRSVSGIRLDNLKKCPECERYFLHLSKRKRIFCDNKCASRYLTRQRRSESKEARAEYRERMKNYMQKRRKEESKWEPKKTKG
jgi:hypothetical protein